MTKQSVSFLGAYAVSAERVVPLKDVTLKTAEQGCYHWLHLDGHDLNTRRWCEENLHSRLVDHLFLPETRPLCEVFEPEGGLLLNLRGVNLNEGADLEDMVSLRAFVSKDLVITLRLRRLFAVEALLEKAEMGQLPLTPLDFIAEVAAGLTERIERVSLDIEEQANRLEDALLAETQIEGLELTRLRSRVIKLARYLAPQSEALSQLDELAETIEGRSLQLFSKSTNRTKRALEEMEANKERLKAFQEQYTNMRNQILSQNSYILSIVAAIFLPLGFLTGLFGVNVAGMPGIEAPWAFAALCLASVLFGAGLFVGFKWARWL